MENELTLVIKAFERPKAINRLLETIARRGYAHLPIVVVDDSKSALPIKRDGFPRLRVIRAAFDVGLSEGRNIGVRAVKTPYFALFDDDMICVEATRLDEMLAQIKAIPDCDILGGMCRGHERHSYGVYERSVDADGNRRLLLRFHNAIERHPEYIVAHYILNFFVADTARVLEMGGWPTEIKIGREHVTFFAMAMDAGLKVCINRRHRISHEGVKYARHVARFRKRSKQWNGASLDHMETDVLRAVWPSGKVKFGYSRFKEGYTWKIAPSK